MAENLNVLTYQVVAGGGVAVAGNDGTFIGTAVGIAGTLDNLAQAIKANPALSKLVAGVSLGHNAAELQKEIKNGSIKDATLIALATDVLALAALAAAASLSAPALFAIALAGTALSAYAATLGNDTDIADWFSKVPSEAQWAFDPNEIIIYDGKYEPFKKHNLVGINIGTNDKFNAAQNFRWPVDPLVLDLDGDGIETLGVNADTHVLFDHDADGVKTGTGWISGDDGFLVLDRNGNGTIDSGRELFGDQTIVAGQTASDGYAALSAEDTNGNGIFDSKDANFNNVRIWQDKYPNQKTLSISVRQGSPYEMHLKNNKPLTLHEQAFTTSNFLSTLPNASEQTDCFFLRVSDGISQEDGIATSFNNVNYETLKRVA